MKWSPPRPALAHVTCYPTTFPVSFLFVFLVHLCTPHPLSILFSIFKCPWTLRSTSRLLFPWSHEDTTTVEISSPCKSEREVKSAREKRGWLLQMDNDPKRTWMTYLQTQDGGFSFENLRTDLKKAARDGSGISYIRKTLVRKDGPLNRLTLTGCYKTIYKLAKVGVATRSQQWAPILLEANFCFL